MSNKQRAEVAFLAEVLYRYHKNLMSTRAWRAEAGKVANAAEIERLERIARQNGGPDLLFPLVASAYLSGN